MRGWYGTFWSVRRLYGLPRGFIGLVCLDGVGTGPAPPREVTLRAGDHLGGGPSPASRQFLDRHGQFAGPRIAKRAVRWPASLDFFPVHIYRQIAAYLCFVIAAPDPPDLLMLHGPLQAVSTDGADKAEVLCFISSLLGAVKERFHKPLVIGFGAFPVALPFHAGCWFPHENQYTLENTQNGHSQFYPRHV